MNQWEGNSSLLEGNEAKEVIKRGGSKNGADFDSFLVGLWNFGELFLVHCMVGVYSPCLNQFWGSWIPFQVGWWRGHSPLNGAYWWCLVAGWRSIQLNFSSISLLFPLFFSIPPYSHVDGTLVGVVLVLCWVQLVSNIGYMIYGYVVLFPYDL